MHQGKKVDRSGAPLTPAVPFLRVSHTYSADPFSHVCNALFSQLYTKALARPWKHVVIEMTEQMVKSEWKCYMQLSALWPREEFEGETGQGGPSTSAFT